MKGNLMPYRVRVIILEPESSDCVSPIMQSEYGHTSMCPWNISLFSAIHSDRDKIKRLNVN